MYSNIKEITVGFYFGLLDKAAKIMRKEGDRLFEYLPCASPVLSVLHTLFVLILLWEVGSHPYITNEETDCVMTQS